MTEKSTEKWQTIKLIVPSRVDKKMGLGVVFSNHKVSVSNVMPGSLAADYFKFKDRIVSVNGVNVKDKKHCKELILSASTESEFEVAIERPPISGVKTVPDQPTELDQMPDLHFSSGPVAAPKTPQSSPNIKTKKKTPSKPYQAFYLGDDEFALGNPSDGVPPPPDDVREILRQKLPQILADFMESPTGSCISQKSEKKVALTAKIEHDNVQVQNIDSDVPMEKTLMKIKKH